MGNSSFGWKLVAYNAPCRSCDGDRGSYRLGIVFSLSRPLEDARSLLPEAINTLSPETSDRLQQPPAGQPAPLPSVSNTELARGAAYCDSAPKVKSFDSSDQFGRGQASLKSDFGRYNELRKQRAPKEPARRLTSRRCLLRPRSRIVGQSYSAKRSETSQRGGT